MRVRSLGELVEAKISESEETAQRHATWKWCRLFNDFFDMPLWRLAARDLEMPLTQVQALVLRLDAAANKGQPRGDYTNTSVAEIAMSCDVPVKDVDRLIAWLEREEVAWLMMGVVLSFYERNPDQKDTNATDRKRRSRAIRDGKEDLERWHQAGHISTAQLEIALSYNKVHADVGGALRACGYVGAFHSSVQSAAVRGAGMWTDRSQCDRVGHNVTSVGHIVEQSTAPAQQSKNLAVSSSGGARLTTVGLPSGPAVAAATVHELELWLATDGLEIAMGIFTPPDRSKAHDMLGRWRERMGSAPADLQALAELLVQSVQRASTPAQLHVMISDGTMRYQRECAAGRPLPLPPNLIATAQAAAESGAATPRPIEASPTLLNTPIVKRAESA